MQENSGSESRDIAGAEKRDLTRTRILDTPLASAWRAWADPGYVTQWWGPDHFTSPSAEINFHEGETSLVCMRASKEYGGQDYFSTWTYTKIVPMERIEYIHNLSDENGHTLNPTSIGMPANFPQDQLHTVVFKVIDTNRTEATVTQYGWTPDRLMEMADMGLGQSLDKMAAMFSEP